MTKPKPKEEDVQETTTTFDTYKFTSTPPKDVIEAMLADTIKEIYNTFAVTAFQGSNKLSAEESFMAAVNVSRACLYQAADLMSNCQLATLTPKHRSLAKVIPHWLTRFEYIAENVKGFKEDSIELREAAREVTQVISVFHILMDSKTNQKFRNATINDILESTNVA